VSNPDSFIDEVSEELRRDRLFAAMRRYGWIAVVLVLAVVGGASWNEWSKARFASAAEGFGDGVLAAVESGTLPERRAALAALPTTTPGQAAVVQFLLAGSEDMPRAEALAALAQIEADAGLPASYRQLATLKRVALAGADLPLPERRAAVTPLAAPGQPFGPLAREHLALLLLEEGDRDGARAAFEALLREPDLASGLRQRVSQMIVVLGGSLAPDFG
jgi:hypothetical protein